VLKFENVDVAMNNYPSRPAVGLRQ